MTLNPPQTPLTLELTADSLLALLNENNQMRIILHRATQSSNPENGELQSMLRAERGQHNATRESYVRLRMELAQLVNLAGDVDDVVLIHHVRTGLLRADLPDELANGWICPACTARNSRKDAVCAYCIADEGTTGEPDAPWLAPVGDLPVVGDPPGERVDDRPRETYPWETSPWVAGDLVKYDLHGCQFTAILTSQLESDDWWQAVIQEFHGEHELYSDGRGVFPPGTVVTVRWPDCTLVLAHDEVAVIVLPSGRRYERQQDGVWWCAEDTTAVSYEQVIQRLAYEANSDVQRQVARVDQLVTPDTETTGTLSVVDPAEGNTDTLSEQDWAGSVRQEGGTA